MTTASYDSRHRSRRQISVPQILTAPREITATVFETKVIGIDVKAKIRIRIESIKKLVFLKLEKTEFDLTLQLGGRVTVTVSRGSFDTTRKGTMWNSGYYIQVSYSIPIFWVVTLDLDFYLRTPISVSVDPGPLSTSRLRLTITPSVSVTATLQGSVSVLVIRAGVFGDGHLIKGSLPIAVSYDANLPSHRDACVDVSADLRVLELTAGVFYQWRSCWWHWIWFRCRWGTRHTLLSFGRWSALSFTRNLRYECF
ncbi:PREDICTED: uncharacterized protein LOC107349066 [Acropora digitifera]|uniref:uncharacterized protein LOC107349066 n=1 Tax=Acropora digitifera TaxID=70779 RepID=UPI00077AB5F4|nr:PREDICTED: uncharacterized protein LOC107349066 [Acropora digitifera]